MEKFLEGKADSNTLRVLIATDNHLGFLEDDAVRGEDSFSALEEILATARSCHVDMVVLSGDLFHINKPSRATMSKTMNLFRQYCFGEREVELVVRGKLEGDVVNFEDENVAVDLPVFAIHGNHDNRTREGVTLKALSAMDLLSESRLINYFGCSETIEDVQVEPLLIEKGSAKLKLYGMGWIRDERMHHMFSSGKVQFKMMPEETQDGLQRAWYNMMLVHQNRENKGRGSKACFRESFIPDFMDLVIFGHEHECFIEPQECSMNENILLSQPGSSIRTSLSDSECEPKHIAIIEIKLDEKDLAPKMEFTKIPLRSVRPFVYEEISLSSFSDEITGSEADKLEKIETILYKKVLQMIVQARQSHQELNPDLSEAQVKKVLPLIRLRIEYSGFQPINSQRFAGKFVSKVANPNDLLNWYKKRSTSGKSERKPGEMAIEELAMELHDSRQDTTQQINTLVEGILSRSAESLSLLPEKELNDTIFTFVSSDQTAKSIEIFLDDVLEHQQRNLLDNDKIDADKFDDMTSILTKSREQKNKAFEKRRAAQEKADNSDDAQAADEDEQDELMTRKPNKSTRGSKKAGAKRKATSSRKQKEEEEEDDDDDDFGEEEVVSSDFSEDEMVLAKKGKASQRKRVQADADKSPSTRQAKKPRQTPQKKESPHLSKTSPSRTSKRSTRKTRFQQLDFSSSEREEDEESDEEIKASRKTKKRAKISRAADSDSSFPSDTSPKVVQSKPRRNARTTIDLS